ncbi:beta-ketoacyl synthase chain length factor [Chryseobacterium kwangjuense]|uniref:Beta-ketoacyl synthase-like N-terminal domain-containing protein n=1 Tax=Chryseobacterium kwangjuense TaxID=267125 RepID=A0A135W2Q1_9FLAO|nr:beta-ketoacyl synthase chain length factor [Chryseobacterium kwangjuense]KXH79183.1 hypothetical protein AU378_21290 [Chryseobacterium kwangjuense]
MKFYIENSYGIGPFENRDFKDFETRKTQDGDGFKVIEPDYYECLKTHIVRRGSRSAKFGMYAALKCMENQNAENIEGIIVGTSLGGLRNFEEFTLQMIDLEEVNMSPNPFIQSLHSTLSGNLAIELGTYAYNVTYTNRGNAFETALLDAKMSFMEGREQILIGSSDENSANYQFSVAKDHFLNQDNSSQAASGEGAAFFKLVSKKSQDTVTVADVATFYNISHEEFKDKISEILDKNGIHKDDISLVISGLKKDLSEDIHPVETTLFYKDFVGEYATSISFAMWLGENIIRKNTVPDVFGKKEPEEISNVLILNEYRKYKSVIILSKY